MPSRVRLPAAEPRAWLLAAAVLVLAVVPSQALAAVAPDATVGVPETGAHGITETVDEIMARDRSSSQATRPDSSPRLEFDQTKNGNLDALAVSEWPPAGEAALSAVGSPFLPQTVGTSFRTLGLPESGFIPPDTAGDVGPTQILVHVNGRIRVYGKTGIVGALNVAALTFWSSVANSSQPAFPQVRYDRLSGRWILTAVNSTKPNNRVMIAVQTNPGTITGASSFTFYQFNQNGGGGSGDSANVCDSPTLGIDANALYIGCNMFTTADALNRVTVYVVRKSSVIPAPGTLVVTAFRDISNGIAGPGPFTPSGVDNDDAQATEGYFIGADIGTLGLLQIRRVQTPGGTPTLSGNLPLTVLATAPPIPQPASGSSTNLDAGDDRLVRASIHKNKLTGATTLWTSHTSEVDASCVGVSGGGRNGARWYEIAGSAPSAAAPLGGTPTLVQSGTLCDSSPSDPKGYIYPSVVATGQGHMALGSSFAAPNLFAGAAAAGRLRFDPAGATQAPTTLQSGLASYTFVASGRNRWGDYSFTDVDPTDDQTAWTFQEYADSPANNWAVRAVQLKAPPPPTLTGLQAFACIGVASVAVTLTGTSDAPVSGAEFFDPGPDTGGPGYANHLTATVTGGVTVNGAPAIVIPASPSTQPALQVTLSLDTTAATAGLKNITIKNPDGQTTLGVGVVRVDLAVPPVASNNGPVCQGGTIQLSVSSIPHATYLWTGPNGFSSTLQNPTIPNATFAASGTYTVALDGTGCASTPATTTVTVIGDTLPCEDGNACTTGDTCSAGNCVAGAAVVCNDNSVCTADTCNPASGCVYTDTTAVTCNDGDACTADFCNPASGCFHADNTAACNDNNVCTDDSCNPATGCVHANNTVTCDDGSACTTGDTCGGGSCNGTVVACDDGNSCTTDSCNPATGCVHANNTVACNDGSACTTGDTCGGGSCQPGTAVVCGDDNVCTDDSCNPASGCVHTNNTAACTDGNPCTANDTCSGGNCQPGAATVCNDDNACTTDSCNPAVGCVFTDNTAACNDNNRCTDDSCNPASGCVHTDNTAACTDGNQCTANDTCSGGSCQPGPPTDCFDNNICTDDACSPTAGCVWTDNELACDDESLCTTGDICSGGTCGGTAVVCDDQNPCTDNNCDPSSGCYFSVSTTACDDDDVCTDDSCEPASGCVHANNTAACNDGSACTAGDTCGAGSCQPGTAVVCYDNNVCTADVCDPASGCVYTDVTGTVCNDDNVCTRDECDPLGGCFHPAQPGPCNDGNLCTAGDTCGGGSCQPGTVVVCNDNNVCTDDICDSGWGCVFTDNAAACDDGSACTTGDLCVGGSCQHGAAVVCNDNNPCTADSCDPASGCVFSDAATACDDGNPCTADSCNPATGCVHANVTGACDDGSVCTTGDTCDAGVCRGTAIVCDDGNLCTRNLCNPVSGCFFTNNTALCDDGDACTAGDRCAAGTCRPGTAVDCNDNNVCSDDSCNPATGCVHANNTAACQDGNACTTGDTCGGGTCQPGTAVDCYDNNVCTADTCDPASGCVHTDVTGTVCNDDNVCTGDECDPLGGCFHPAQAGPCDDGNLCTAGDTCGGGSCQSGTQVMCDDNNLCTDDICDSGWGCVFTDNAAACDDGSACTAGDICVSGSCQSGAFVLCNDDNLCTADNCDPVAGCVFTNGTTACDDGNPCTADSCNPATGCGHAIITGACDDGSACTTGDTCAAGVCQGTPIVCDDANPCTRNICIPVSGCFFPNNTVVCDDGNACTVGDRCAGGTCRPGAAVDCNDNDVCTNDECHPVNGCFHTFNTAPCDDGVLCTNGDTCNVGTCSGVVGSPPEVHGLSAAGGVTTTWSWTGQPVGTHYDLATSAMADLRTSGTSGATCLADDVPGTSTADTQPNPAAGEGYYYLIRAQSVCGTGTYGFDSVGIERTPAAACP